MAKRVLIVDDTAFMRMSLRNVLEKNGYEVVDEAAKGEEAVEKYQVTNPDVVTIDITSPRRMGLRPSRRLWPLIPTPELLSAAQWDRSPW